MHVASRWGAGRGAAFLALVGLGLGIVAPPAGASETVRMFALERRPGGGVEVVTFDAPVGARALTRSRDTLSVEVDAPVSAFGTDPMRPWQWALDAVPYEPTWSTTTGRGVTVAVVDTGVRGDHQDLAGALLPGVDFVAGGDGRIDPGGHGTHVAGIIAARAGNRLGVAGAAPGVRILPVRVLDEHGSGYASAVAEGIIWAADHGARVINLSLGGPSPSPGMQQAIRFANSRGAVVLAASGNGAQSGNVAAYPAVYPEAIAVGAIETGRTRAPYSNYGSYLDVVAPGSAIVSTYGSGPEAYAWASGTSMATPYAAAAAALVVAAKPDLDAAGVRRHLEETATDLGARGADPEFGHGLVNPRQAVTEATRPRGWGTKGVGYWVVSTAGRVLPYGMAEAYGDLSGRHLDAPIVAGARTPSGRGYWLAGADGAVYAFGDAPALGSMAGRRLNAPIVGMAATRRGDGYLLLGADGGIFTFGAARFHGSTGDLRLNAPVLDFTMTASGGGYWMVAADGGVFAFGDADFHGSTGDLRLNSPAASMTAAPDGSGYWIVARDGGIFAFDVPFHGSLPGLGTPLPGNGERIRSLRDGSGYYLLAADGGVHSFGTARFLGAAPLGGFEPAVDLLLA